MKLQLVIVLAAVLGVSNAVKYRIDERIEPFSSANLDGYVDEFLRHWGTFLINNNVDPLAMPDMNLTFSFTVLFVEYKVDIQLTDGYAQDISTLRRSGDCYISYDHRMVNIGLKLGIPDLLVSFDYKTRVIMDLEGQVTANVRGMDVEVGAMIDLERTTISLQSLKLGDPKSLDVKFTGLGLLGDPIVNGLSDGFTWVFKSTIINEIQKQMTTLVENFIDQIPPLFDPLDPNDPNKPNPAVCEDNLVF